MKKYILEFGGVQAYVVEASRDANHEVDMRVLLATAMEKFRKEKNDDWTYDLLIEEVKKASGLEISGPFSIMKLNY